MNWKYHNPKFEYEESFNDLAWPWAGHKFFAYDLIRNVKPKRVVELGTHYGTSFWSFCQAVKDEKLDAELFAIDTWKGDKHAGFYGEEVFETVKKIKNAHYPDLKINLIRKTFDEASFDFENNSIDLLHIDGLHTYEAVKHDFEKWIRKINNNGIVILHDIAEKENDFGVWKLWDELKNIYNTIGFSHSHGLGIIFKNAEIFENIRQFESVWQKYYPLLQRVRNINQPKHQMESKESYIARLIQQKDQEIKILGREIQQKNQEIKNLNQSIQQKDQEIGFMKSSKFWKIREKYLYLKNGLRFAIFSPHNFIKKHFLKK